jgi:ceroid-lipofuscinosis protein 8
MILKDKMFWSLAIVRGTYGLIGTLFSVYERFFDADLLVHPTNSKTELSYLIVLSHFGFFIFEWSAQIYFDVKFKTLNTQLHAHHLISFIGYFGSAWSDTMHYAACSAFILEMSTPFSCICYCLIKTKQSDSALWKINQFILIHTFHLRSVVEFTLLYETYKYWSDFSQIPIYILVNWIFGLLVVALYLTPFWTWKKTEQMFTKSDWSSDNQNSKKKN